MKPPFPIPWPLSSAPGNSPQESGGRLLNCSAEPLGEAGPTKASWKRRSGLTAFADSGFTPYRGGILVNGLAYIAAGSHIVTVTSGGVVATAGNLPGTDKVSFAQNNSAPPAIQCVSPANGAFAVTSSSVTAFTGGGNLPSPNSVCGQDGYLFWSIGDNRVFAAGPNSTTVNSNTFITVQSRPTGNLLRLVPYQGLLFCFASEFCEVYSNTSNPFPAFPYSRYSVIDCGLFGQNSITGYEGGFGAMYWAGQGPDGLGIYRLAGGSPQKVSPPDLDRLLEAVPAGQSATVEVFCYQADGKNFIVVSNPAWTWEFDLGTQKWNERDSVANGQFGRWRATGPSLHAFEEWIIGDTLSTKIGIVDPNSNQEFGSPIRMRMESGPVETFPNRAQIARADFNFVTGVGQSSSLTATGRDPQVSIWVSRDGGQTWGSSRLRKLGQQANMRQRVYATNWGQSTNQGPRWRIDISDEVYAAFMGGTMSPDIRAF